METKLLQIIQDEILGSPEPLTPESDLFDAGLDSMAIMQLSPAHRGPFSSRPRTRRPLARKFPHGVDKSPPSSRRNADPTLLRATSSDAFLLGLESLMRRSGQGPHLAATVIQLAGEPDPAAIRLAAAALGRRHALLHARLRRSPVTFTAGWLPGPPAAVPVTLHETRNPSELVARILNAGSIDIFRPGPNLEIHILPQGENHSIILLWPHSLFDAIGIDKLIAELDSTDSEPRHDWGETTTASGGAAALWRTAHPIIEEMRTFPASNIRSLHQPGRPPGAARFEVLAFSPEDTQTIHAKMARTSGELLKIPYFAAVSARAVARVMRERETEPPDILLSLPIQRIQNPSARPLFHNHMVAWSLLLDHQNLDELAPAAMALCRSYASFMKRGLPAAMEALTKLCERCPSRLYLLTHQTLPQGRDLLALPLAHSEPSPPTPKRSSRGPSSTPGTSPRSPPRPASAFSSPSATPASPAPSPGAKARSMPPNSSHSASSFSPTSVSKRPPPHESHRGNRPPPSARRRRHRQRRPLGHLSASCLKAPKPSPRKSARPPARSAASRASA